MGGSLRQAAGRTPENRSMAAQPRPRQGRPAGWAQNLAEDRGFRALAPRRSRSRCRRRKSPSSSGPRSFTLMLEAELLGSDAGGAPRRLIEKRSATASASKKATSSRRDPEAVEETRSAWSATRSKRRGGEGAEGRTAKPQSSRSRWRLDVRSAQAGISIKNYAGGGRRWSAKEIDRLLLQKRARSADKACPPGDT